MAKVNSPTVPKSNTTDGIPSVTKLIKRPKPNPSIKSIFDIVAAFQYEVCLSPINQKVAKHKYKPMMAL